MGNPDLPGEAVCRILMREIRKTIRVFAKGQADLLRYGAKTKGDEYMGRHILTLRSASLSESQVEALEAVLRQVQEELIDWLFCVIDGSCQPKGLPDKMRLVNLDTGEEICPEWLAWAFSMAELDQESPTDTDSDIRDGSLDAPSL